MRNGNTNFATKDENPEALYDGEDWLIILRVLEGGTLRVLWGFKIPSAESLYSRI